MFKSITLLFPGQGSQYVGMTKNLAEESIVHQTFDPFYDRFNINLKKICWEGPEDELKKTENTQPAIVAHSYILLQKLKSFLDQRPFANKLSIQKVLGHSVGEYSALVAGGVLSIEDALPLVHYRGKYMQQAVPLGEGSMVALLKVPQDMVEKGCEFVSQNNKEGKIVSPANFNTPDQLVISGHTSACEELITWLKSEYKKRFLAKFLEVSAPFHCQLMKHAEEKMIPHLNASKWNSLNTSYVANVDARIYGPNTNTQIIKENLIHQICGPVLWSQSLTHVDKESLCLEVGPGSVLTNMLKKAFPELTVLPLDKEESWKQLGEILK